jgi:ADP-ribose pyrophosphatase YjhB (NUDIX family)
MKFDQLLPSPFYRVSIKIIVKDESDRLLMVRVNDQWEVPGGGWEHNESFEDCLKREIKEELGVGLKSHSGILFFYRGLNIKNYMALRLAVKAELTSLDLQSTDPEIEEAKFISQAELINLPMSEDEGAVRQFTDQIWSQ